jgi:hypothetical protein
VGEKFHSVGVIIYSVDELVNDWIGEWLPHLIGLTGGIVAAGAGAK